MKLLSFILLASLGLVCLTSGHTIRRSDGLHHSRVRREITSSNFDKQLKEVKEKVDSGFDVNGIKDIIGDIAEIAAEKGVSISLKAAKGIEKAAGLVASSISAAERKIRDAIAKLEVIAPKFKEQIKGVDKEYRDLIENLEETRLALFGLADETIVKCKEYDSLIQDWDQYKDDQDYLLELMYTTKALMERTLKAIGLAEGKYKVSKAKLEKLIGELATIRVAAETEQGKVDAASAYNSMWTKFGLSFVTTMGNVAGKVANIVEQRDKNPKASITSGIAGAITGIVSDIALNVKTLQDNKAKLKQMEDDFKEILDTVEVMTEKFENTKLTLQKESEILKLWQGRAKSVLETMEAISELPKDRLGRIRIKMKTAAKVGMCELREAAEKWKLRQSIDFIKGILKSGDIKCTYNKSEKECSCS